MGIEAIKGRGVNRANVICDDCGRKEPVTCDYDRKNGGEWLPNEGQAKTKITAHGWTDIKGKLRCPSCEAKRKVVPMKPKEAEKPNREMTPKEKVQIYAMLAEVYDMDGGGYLNGDTDETVAEVLGVMPGWVANIREADFGPSGGNENIEELAERLAKLEADLPAIIEAAKNVTETGVKRLAEVSAMRADLEKIKAAVGPRVRQRAGVK